MDLLSVFRRLRTVTDLSELERIEISGVTAYEKNLKKYVYLRRFKDTLN